MPTVAFTHVKYCQPVPIGITLYHTLGYHRITSERRDALYSIQPFMQHEYSVVLRPCSSKPLLSHQRGLASPAELRDPQLRP